MGGWGYWSRNATEDNVGVIQRTATSWGHYKMKDVKVQSYKSYE